MYIGNSPTSQAFVTDYFNGDGTTVAYTMSVAPANSSSIEVIVAGVPQYPNTYSVNSTTLTFSAAPPAGTGNIFVRYLGIPATGVTTTAYRTVTEFTATASQTTFVPPSYTVGYINVYQNGSLLGSADYTATNGTTVVLAVGATVGDLVVVESFYVSSVLNAIPAVNGAVGSTYLANGAATQIFLDSASGTGTGALRLPVGTTAQRPAGATGLIRQNSTTGNPEWWDATTSQWLQFSQPAGYTVNYLVVAGGGGGGGAYYSGGGGAGGLLQGTSTLSSGASYPIIIGAGGNGGSTTSVGGVNGSSSTALTLTAIGGGGGGSYSSVAAQSGGSGGGQGGYQFGSVGSGTVGQGYAGGTGALYGGGAGGGAGAVGGNGTTANGGAGGTGASSSISGSATFYAGGGGGGAYGGTGGAGGNGGGGAGASASGAPSAGTANTGGGGGASSGNTGSYYAGAAGGSGIVVISYFGSQRGSGGTVTSVGGYTIHTFTSSGTYIA